MKRIIGFLLLFILVTSCGMHHYADIVNNTGKDIVVELTLVDTETGPSNSSLIDWEIETTTEADEYLVIGDCNPVYNDSLNILKLSIKKDWIVNLGPIRMDLTRDSIKSWGIEKIRVEHNTFQLEAENNGILSLINKERTFLGRVKYHLTIGNKNR